jgi:hypothetical protein
VTISCNDWIIPWSRSSHLVLDDSDNYFGNPSQTRIEIANNQATLCLGLFNYAYLLPAAPILPLLKSEAHVSTLADGWK